MANKFTSIEQTKQNVSTLTNERKCAHQENKLCKGNIVYKKDTGMAFLLGRVSVVNGIEHHQLICARTNSRYFLSKFALERDYTDDSVEVEKFGQKITRRLSEMWGK